MDDKRKKKRKDLLLQLTSGGILELEQKNQLLTREIN